MRDWEDHQDLEPLIRDLVQWVGPEPRPYAEVMDAWRTSCPRLTIWEDAVERGLVQRQRSSDGVELVAVTQKGRTLLSSTRPS
jgi:D-3-phosphoglycerate dehydrogenase